MKRYPARLLIMALVSSLGLFALGGCGKSDEEEVGAKGGGGARAKKGGGGGGAKALTAKGYATSVKGRVAYNGGDDADKLYNDLLAAPTKDQDACPPKVPTRGWYLKNSKDKKGVQYALVFLRAPSGSAIPKGGEADKLPEKDSKPVEIVTVSQPHCQFEPRVLALHPMQKIRFVNDSNTEGRKGIQHDSKVTNSRNSFQQSMPPGGEAVWNLDPSDTEPNQVSCGIHQSTMSAYVWKMTHPYAVVSDADGNFELKNVPVTEPKLEVWVWHEMLSENKNMKKVSDLNAEVGKEFALPDIAIPK